MKMRGLFAAAIVGSVSLLSPAWGAPAIPIKDAVVTMGVPLWESTPPPPPAGNKGPMIIDVTQVNPADNTKTITTSVPVSNLPKYIPPVIPAFVRPPYNPALTPFQNNQLVAAAYQAWVQAGLLANQAKWEAASKDKADKIAAAINAKLGPGTAVSAVGPANPATGYKPGIVTITNAQRVTHGKKSNTTGENGDGVRFQNGAGGGGTSPYSYKMTMGTPTGLPITSAAGVDPNGGPSVVEFGVINNASPSQNLVATWFPNAGDSVATVLSDMQQLLESNSTFVSDGYSAVFDATALTLTLLDTSGSNFHDGQDTFVWSMNDINFDGELGVTAGADIPAVQDVPEPASLLVLGLGVGGMLLSRKGRARRIAA